MLAARDADALSLADLTQQDATAAVKAARERGAQVAVELLGRTDGFRGNDTVRLPLPDWLKQADSALKLAGRGKDIDELRLAVNRAAEQAVPEAKAPLVRAARDMSVQDAEGILTGGDDSVAKLFATKTREPLTGKFLPIVTKVAEKIGLARQYHGQAARGEQLGLLRGDPTRVEAHVTTKALDVLYFMLGEEEKRLRHDPVGTGSTSLKQLFGAIK